MEGDVKPSRVLFYAHFNEFGRVEDYVVYQLQQMRGIFDTIVLVSNSPVSEKDQTRLSSLCDTLMQRENVGFDFAAWRDGMNAFGWTRLTACREITVMNDTCFGPLFDFDELYSAMQSRGCDFWGITTNIALPDVLVDGDRATLKAPAHIQSYYMTFNAGVISAPIFKEFWTGVKDYPEALDVIDNYEVGLTRVLTGGGFTFSVFFDAVNHWSSGHLDKYNTVFACPLWLVESVDRYPFIKTKAIRLDPEQVDGLRSFIENHTSYPVQLVDSYIGGRYYALWKEKDDEIQSLRNSRAFRVSQVLASPFRGVMRMVGR
ncbi:MAG: hypothetical protein FWD63_00435 [Propionibacteriaceae bacterium]|nr:hypothetical protein [Propionibacteriaceae bacterium]